MWKKVLKYLEGRKTYLLGAAYLVVVGLESNGTMPSDSAKVWKDVLEGGMLLTIRFGMKKKQVDEKTEDSASK